MKFVRETFYRTPEAVGTLLEILQNSQENTCARASFLIKSQASGLRPATLLRLWYWCFPMNFGKFLRTPFSQNTSWQLLLIVLWKVSLTNFTKCTGKQLFQSPFLNKSEMQAWNFPKKRLQHRCFYVSFVNFLWTPISQNTWKQLLLKLFKIPFWEFIFSKFADLQKICSNFDKTWTPSSFRGIFQWFCPLSRETFIKEVLSVHASSPWWVIWKSNVIFSWHSCGFFIQLTSASSNLIKGPKNVFQVAKIIITG